MKKRDNVIKLFLNIILISNLISLTLTPLVLGDSHEINQELPSSIGIIKKAINDLAFSPDGEILAGAFESADANGSIKFWNLTSNEFLYEFDYGYWNEVYSIDFSPDGTLLAVGDGYSTDIWDFNSRELLYILKYENHRNNVYSVDFSPNGKFLASSGWNNTVMIWNVSNGKPIFRLIGHNNSIRSVHFSPDSTKLVSGSEDDTLKIWNVSTGNEIMTLKGHSGDVYSAKFGSKGEIIVSGAWYDSSIIWNSTTGKLLQKLHGCQYGVADLDFSPDGGKIAAGEWCRTARLWNSETGNVIGTLNGEYDNQVGTFVVCVAFSPKNDVLATGHVFDGQSFILFWQTNFESEMNISYSWISFTIGLIGIISILIIATRLEIMKD